MSPVMARSPRTGPPENADTSAATIVTGRRPFRRLRARPHVQMHVGVPMESRVEALSSGVGPRPRQRDSHRLLHGLPRRPVRVSALEPGIRVASTETTSQPPAAVRYSPTATPGRPARRVTSPIGMRRRTEHIHDGLRRDLDRRFVSLPVHRALRVLLRSFRAHLSLRSLRSRAHRTRAPRHGGAPPWRTMRRAPRPSPTLPPPGCSRSPRASSKPDASRSAPSSSAPAWGGRWPAPTPSSPCAAASSAAASRISRSDEPQTPHEGHFTNLTSTLH